MIKKNNVLWVGFICVISVIGAGWYYAEQNYQEPEAPPKAVWSHQGPVIVQDDTIASRTLVTAPDLGTIYYLNDDQERVVFPDEQTFLSWYENYDDVEQLSREKLESFPLSGRNATIRPGTLLITIASSPQVWVISHPKNLHWMSGGEAQAIGIFGANWEQRLVDLPEYYFVNYIQDSDFSVADTYPVGLLVHVKSNDQYYLITENGQRLVTEAGMKANHLQTKYAIEREEPIDFAEFGPSLDQYEPKWGSPDPMEQRKDPGPIDLEVGNEPAVVG